MDHWVSLFEVYTPVRGDEGMGMKDIHDKLELLGLGMTENDFYTSSFKALLQQKIKAYREAKGLPDQGAVPRYARPASGSHRFFGVRLAA